MFNSEQVPVRPLPRAWGHYRGAHARAHRRGNNWAMKPSNLKTENPFWFQDQTQTLSHVSSKAPAAPRGARARSERGSKQNIRMQARERGFQRKPPAAEVQSLPSLFNKQPFIQLFFFFNFFKIPEMGQQPRSKRSGLRRCSFRPRGREAGAGCWAPGPGTRPRKQAPLGAPRGAPSHPDSRAGGQATPDPQGTGAGGGPCPDLWGGLGSQVRVGVQGQGLGRG